MSETAECQYFSCLSPSPLPQPNYVLQILYASSLTLLLGRSFVLPFYHAFIQDHLALRTDRTGPTRRLPLIVASISTDKAIHGDNDDVEMHLRPQLTGVLG